MLTLLRLVITAAKRYHKKTTLTDLDVELAVLQNQIRLAKDLTYLPINKYQHWSGLNLEIGRMIGGWRLPRLPHLPHPPPVAQKQHQAHPLQAAPLQTGDSGRQANGRRLPTMHPIVVCARRACKHLAAALQPV